MSICLQCELHPVVHFNGAGLCADHADQWIATETRHAPALSGPMLARDRRSPQKGIVSNTPRHYK